MVVSQSPEIWFLLSGTATVKVEDVTIELNKGEAVFLCQGSEMHISSGKGELFRCLVPLGVKN